MANATYATRLQFDVTALGAKETVLQKWPALATHRVLSQYGSGPEGDALMRYALLMCDPKSPLHTDIPDWENRKTEARRLAKMPATVFHDCEAGLEIRWYLLRYIFQSRKMMAYYAALDAYAQNCQKAAEMIAGGGEGDKADTELRAYDLRGKLLNGLNMQEEQITAWETALFREDEALKARALAGPVADEGSQESVLRNLQTRSGARTPAE